MAKTKKSGKKKRACLNCGAEISDQTPTIYKCCESCREGITDIGVVKYPLHYHDCGGGRHIIKKYIDDE